MSTIAGIRGERVDKIINGFCEYYGVVREDVSRANKGKGKKAKEAWKWRKYLVVVLNDHTDLDLTEIKTVLGYVSTSTVKYTYETVKEHLSEEVYGSPKIKLAYNQLLKHLQL